MALFVGEHLLQYQLRLSVFAGKGLEVRAKVTRDPFLCRVNKTQTHFVTCQRGGCAQSEGGGIKKRVQFARFGIKLL